MRYLKNTFCFEKTNVFMVSIRESREVWKLSRRVGERPNLPGPALGPRRFGLTGINMAATGSTPLSQSMSRASGRILSRFFSTRPSVLRRKNILEQIDHLSSLIEQGRTVQTVVLRVFQALTFFAEYNTIVSERRSTAVVERQQRGNYNSNR